MEKDKEIEKLKSALADAVHSFTRMETLYKLKCNELESAKDEIAGLTGKVEALQQDNENLRRTLEEGAESSETSFERYLLDKLLKSGCDCCSICAHTPPNELCESENVEDCYCGIREFYERFMEEK